MNIGIEIQSIMKRDPSAKSGLEVIMCYPSFHAIVLYRLNNWILVRLRLRIVARALSQFARFLTGIEIHPGATIGRNLFIDHGAGVVIGETAVIGDDVTLYQSVTLGGVRPISEQGATHMDTQRHPTVCDGVVVGAGAKILGNIMIGKNARVGANAVVLSDVAPHTMVVGSPAVIMKINDDTPDTFYAYGCGDTQDCTEYVDNLAEIRTSMEYNRKRIRALEKALQKATKTGTSVSKKSSVKSKAKPSR